MRSLWGICALAALCACNPVKSGADDANDDDEIDGGMTVADAGDTPDAQACKGDGECPSGHCLDQVCVECVLTTDCSGGKVCDEEAHACRGCEAPTECASTLCEPIEKVCVAADRVVYANAATGSFNECGTQERPCQYLQEALPLLTDARPYLWLFGTFNYPKLTVTGKRTIVGNGVGALDFTNVGGSDTQGALIAIKGGADVIIDGLTIKGNAAGPGIECPAADSKLWLSHSIVSNNQGNGVDGGCDLTITDSELTYNDGYGVSAQQLVLQSSRIANNGSAGVQANVPCDIRNNVFERNGGEYSYTGAVHIYAFEQPTVPCLIAYNTIVGNTLTGSERGLVACSGDNQAANNITVDSNILWDNHLLYPPAGNPGNAQVTGCSLIGKNVCDYSLNLTTIVEDPRFVDLGSGDYHLTDSSPAKDKGTLTNALGWDFDGTQRDAKPDMGAFEH